MLLFCSQLLKQMSSKQKEKYDEKFKLDLQYLQEIKKPDSTWKGCNMKMVVSCEPRLIEVWEKNGKCYFGFVAEFQFDENVKIEITVQKFVAVIDSKQCDSGQLGNEPSSKFVSWYESVFNAVRTFFKHGWREILKFFDHQFNQYIVFGKYADAFKMLVYEYELRSNFWEILKHSPDENMRAMYRICLGLAKVLYSLEFYKAAVQYCRHGRTYFVESCSKIDFDCIEDKCSFFMDDEGEDSDEDGEDFAPHSCRRFFESVVLKLTEVTRDTYNKRIERFINLEKYISKQKFDIDKRNFECASKKFVVSSASKTLSSSTTVTSSSSMGKSLNQDSSSSDNRESNHNFSSTSCKFISDSVSPQPPLVNNNARIRETVSAPQKVEPVLETKKMRRTRKRKERKKLKAQSISIAQKSAAAADVNGSDEGEENDENEPNETAANQIVVAEGLIEAKFFSKNKFEALTDDKSKLPKDICENEIRSQVEEIEAKPVYQQEQPKQSKINDEPRSKSFREIASKNIRRETVKSPVCLKPQNNNRQSPRCRDLPDVGQVSIFFGCFGCVTYVGGGLYATKSVSHRCSEGVAFFRSFLDSPEYWVMVRPRNPSAYNPDLCKFLYYKEGCYRIHDTVCNFAHSDLEKYLWAQDVRKRLDLTAFLNEEKDLWQRQCTILQNVLKPNEKVSFQNAPLSSASAMRNQPHNETKCDENKTINPWSVGFGFGGGNKTTVVEEKLDEIFERIQQAKNKSDVLTDDAEFARLVLNKDSKAVMRVAGNNRGKKLAWTFELLSSISLKRVVLMKTRFAHYFRISSRNGNPVDGFGADFIVGSISRGSYEIRVEFLGTKTLGTYDQEVVFDFGSDQKMLRRLLTVHVGVQHQQIGALSRFTRMRDLLNLDNCWTKENVEIIWISNERDYAPISTSELVTNWRYDVDETTFFPMMKKWVTAEEMRRRSILAKFRLKTNAKLSSALKFDGRTIKPFPEGALFVELDFDDPINEDYDVVDLLSGYCKNAFIGLADDKSRNKFGKRRVYEVHLVGRQNFGVEGMTQSSIALCLSSLFVKHYGLNPGDRIKLEVQFNLNHKDFESWHCSLNILSEKKFTYLVYPDLSNHFSAYSNGSFANEIISRHPKVHGWYLKWKNSGKNDDQCRVLLHVALCALNSKFFVPPFVVFGPFGTGKTNTMAEAAWMLLTEPSLVNTKILICAHSNSTADHYLKLFTSFTSRDFTDGMLKELVWRIFPKKTNLDTLPPFIKPFCRVDSQGRFEKLTMDYLKQVRIVICTLTGAKTIINLAKYNPGSVSFTHVFLDEAAQSLEVETLMPLCTVSKKTCVVVAGDPFQLKPTVYMTECNQLLTSYLERLYLYYESQQRQHAFPSDGCVPKVFFNKVYRCHPDILAFVSTAFYGEKFHLESCAKVIDVAFKALYFQTAFGIEEISPDSISYRNEGEATEVVAQVEYFIKNWPKEWGIVDIGIAVAHYDQMKLIQNKLREYEKRENKNFSGLIHVGKVISFQGKEFKVLIISTVRGRSILNGATYEKGKLGFLDDRRLINTAMTRTQYCVVVVGDPFALASIGECKYIWRHYIKFCYERNSFMPETYPIEKLKQQVEIIEKFLIQDNKTTA